MNQIEIDRDLRLLLRAYNDVLEETLRGYRGRFHEIIIHAPDLFRLLCNLRDEPRVPSSSRPIINATLLYFIAPFDAIPEGVYGPVGYLDDIFLSAKALLNLQDQMGYEVLASNWEGKGELREVLRAVDELSREFVENLEDEILDYFGVWMRQCSSATRHDPGAHVVRKLLQTI